MNEITQFIQRLEARYEKVGNEITYYDTEGYEYRREGRERELEEVISELKQVVEAFKKRISERAKSIDECDTSECSDWDCGAIFLESKTLKKIVNEL